jgi:hypothetical protein
MIANVLNTQRLNRSLSALLAAVLLTGAAALSLPPSPAQAATPTQLTNVQFSWMGGLLSRTQVRYVTVSLTLVDPDGIVPFSVSVVPGQARIRCPCVGLSHDPRVEPRSRLARFVTLRLASGTNTNGVWTGRFALGAADAGFWRPTSMAAGDIIGHNNWLPPDIDAALTAMPAPWNQLTINVRGYDWPRAWLGTPVKTGSLFTVRGGVGLSRSGVPVAGMRLQVTQFCDEIVQWPLTSKVVRTDTRGRYAYTVLPERLSHQVCAAWVAYPTDTPDSYVVQSNVRNRG